MEIFFMLYALGQAALLILSTRRLAKNPHQKE